MEIVASIQRSKFGLHDWSLSDLTIGLFLIYLQQASKNSSEEVKGVQIFSDSIVSTGTLYFENLIAESQKLRHTSVPSEFLCLVYHLFTPSLRSMYSANFCSSILICLLP